ncbi:MAG: bifunctional 23S rRNA (guanine(2069)-N(7))-methyltransferase RlmK/23S rRNA (guanine(2445)-N(2))-methyltransferase RlmL [Legionellaceae bacterium]|nr:bifunctional 23S rRNA (guanine(2069)-N(7))-methyltransferase RlmK/23S rRNA (guanine(2445)-N(2))-methyltransferase RlmL [Legionellaceae bacterium]
MIFSLFISAPKGLEYLLEEELKSLGFTATQVNPQGVYGKANLSLIYHLCLWSRVANRIQVILFSGPVSYSKMLYTLCRQFSWEKVFSSDKSFAVEFHGTSDEIRNSMYGAQVVKDSIADYFREQNGMRPEIDREHPQIRLHAHLKNDMMTVSFDVTGYSMHQRGYRSEAGRAPLKENIAAAMLLRAKWPQLAEEGFALQDPFCGSGTLVIEAAMMCAHMAPGLLRDDQSLHHWAQHQPALWEEARSNAQAKMKPVSVSLYGSDHDQKAIHHAKINAKRANVSAFVKFEMRDVNASRPQHPQGLLICNPPYGERLGEVTELLSLYQDFGRIMHSHYQGWQAAILTSNPMLSKATGLRAGKQYSLYNGALACKLYCVTLDAQNQLKGREHGVISDKAQMLVNRLQKNKAHLQKWAKRNQVSCYRVYDADLPEYAFAIDIYNDYAVLQEYAAPAIIPEHKTEQRTLDVMQVTPVALDLPVDHIVVKQRKKQKGTAQYQKMDKVGRTLVVREGQAQFTINLYDYLDTGLFLDHRLLRLRFAKLKPGVRFLNCFCYTATASVHAALAGAYTTSVDLSNTYLNWAEDNFRLNKLDLSKHQFIQADCTTWLNDAREKFEVIFLDPPSFSNSKRMSNTLDIQRDHESLIHAAMRLLTVDGTLYFSTNFRQFKLSPEISEQYTVRDITAETIDLDFKRDQKIHQCFMIKGIPA